MCKIFFILTKNIDMIKKTILAVIALISLFNISIAYGNDVVIHSNNDSANDASEL